MRAIAECSRLVDVPPHALKLCTSEPLVSSAAESAGILGCGGLDRGDNECAQTGASFEPEIVSWLYQFQIVVS